MSVLGTIFLCHHPYVFMGSRNYPKPPYGSPILHSPGSRHYDTPRASAVRHDDGHARTIPKRHMGSTTQKGTGILTGFPFGHVG